ncbi:MAG: GAF domain-containing protein [Bacteroidota bacterium]
MTETQKSERYQRIYLQLKDLFVKTDNNIARMATTVALLHNKFDYYFWTGFYLLEKGELTVGPYQGSLACMVLRQNTGVCWAGINQKKAILVENVDDFPGHIACDSRSQSEVVIPLFKNNQIIAILDVDSKELGSFSEADVVGLQKIIELI